MSVIMKMKNSNPSLNGYKKTRRTALTESSEINKTSHNIVNNPLVESFFSKKNFTSDQVNVLFSPQIRTPRKFSNLDQGHYINKSSRIALPPIKKNNRILCHPPKSTKVLTTPNHKDTDPIRAYMNTHNNTEVDLPVNVSNKSVNIRVKNSSSKLLNYVKPEKKKSSSQKIIIDLNNSLATKSCAALVEEGDTCLIGKNVSRHSELSQAGKDERGKTKTNQDNYVMIEALFKNENVNFFGVMDGHGSNGHLVSEFVKNSIISYFMNKELYSNKKSKEITPEIIYNKLTTKDFFYLRSFYIDLNSDLNTIAKFDVHFSGTTCVMIYQIANKLICSNIGDSRAILITSDSNNNYYSEQLSFDHKPDHQSEKERIESHGGRIAPCDDELESGGPIRVWVKGEKYPGIAISRTLGDDVAHSVGVTCNPDIIVKDITKEMCFIVVASDGVWEFLSNEKVKEIVIPYYERNDSKGAAIQVVREATNLWKDEGLAMDDITCIVYFMKGSSSVKKISV